MATPMVGQCPGSGVWRLSLAGPTVAKLVASLVLLLPSVAYEPFFFVSPRLVTCSLI